MSSGLMLYYRRKKKVYLHGTLAVDRHVHAQRLIVHYRGIGEEKQNETRQSDLCDILAIARKALPSRLAPWLDHVPSYEYQQEGF